MHKALIPFFLLFVPPAARWAAKQEKHILATGVPLHDAELAAARRIGVREPERVRLLRVERVPIPTNALLRAVAKRFDFLTGDAAGMSLRYGIFINTSSWRRFDIVCHELVHTAQYERLGGFKPFLRQYFRECLTDGYAAAPMELEAVKVGRIAIRELPNEYA